MQLLASLLKLYDILFTALSSEIPKLEVVTKHLIYEESKKKEVVEQDIVMSLRHGYRQGSIKG